MRDLSGVTAGGTVPIVFTYRRVTKRPEIRRTKSFIGWKRVVGTLLYRAIEWVEELAYVSEITEISPGREQAVHWALQVEDPWSGDMQSNLVVTRMPDRPACGANFEIIRIEEPDAVPEDGSPMRARRPANFEEARGRMREMLQREEEYADAGSPPVHDDQGGRSFLPDDGNGV